MCAKFYRNRTFTFKVMISDEKFRISLRQSWKKWLGQSVQFGSKSLPLSPNAMLGHVARGRARPTLIDGGWGRI